MEAVAGIRRQTRKRFRPNDACVSKDRKRLEGRTPSHVAGRAGGEPPGHAIGKTASGEIRSATLANGAIFLKHLRWFSSEKRDKRALIWRLGCVNITCEWRGRVKKPMRTMGRFRETSV